MGECVECVFGCYVGGEFVVDFELVVDGGEV